MLAPPPGADYVKSFKFISSEYTLIYKLFECLFSPYSDCGIFGNWFFGNEVFTRQMNYCGVALPTIYGHYINDVEVVRARNTLYNELMGIQSASDVMQ